MSRGPILAAVTLIACAGILLPPGAHAAGVTVAVSGNQASATNISLSDGTNTYQFNLTITFDSGVSNLTPAELNITADIVNPGDPSLVSRLCSTTPTPCDITIDPAFPVMVTVEPINQSSLFDSGFESGEATHGDLAFLNTYTFEIETSDLPCIAANPGDPCAATPYRLFKSPVAAVPAGDTTFRDVSLEILRGSVRARGTGGSFSQFMIVSDLRSSALVAQVIKVPALRQRILAATLTASVGSDLLTSMNGIDDALLISDYTTALNDLDQMIAEIQAHAGVDIANAWSSDHTLVNDAGELLTMANSLRFSIARLQAGGP